ncbi:VOC family protein [Serratia aquatilis]|uniref:VOC family protein n=1 Tax=Serratia aquatilis TaxID=1737515 RepID=A0ABV6EDL5_9GAMM
MLSPTMTIIYVDSPERSADFYQRLLGAEPVELSPTFAMFVFNNGFKLAMWSKHTVEPAAKAVGGGTEICFVCQQPEQVDDIYQQWLAKGLTIAQHPLEMDFGYTFVAEDPDGHRLRVYKLNE